MLLSKLSLQKKINIGLVIKRTSNSQPGIKPECQKGSSLDLTVGRIFEPTGNKITIQTPQEIDNSATTRHSIGPGEMVVVEVREDFEMPRNLGGIIFPPNRMAKEGLLMTNPGHVDPGYSGLITLCLVNMGKQIVTIKKGDVIARLLVFTLDKETERYTGPVGIGVDKHQLNSLDKDFAALNKRLPTAIANYMAKSIGVSLAIIGLVFAAYALLIPELSKYRLELKKESEITQQLIAPMKSEIEKNIKERDEIIYKKLDDLSEKIKLICNEAKSKYCDND
jgi:deoxycytidine triphosphate deaminase|uniref:dCTP deaminase domain-containing protein n=1 Tax=Pseudoalteromonas carrageenovora TaxID=227 RepID=UPI0026E3D427|nr:hypothetical protein [Pseudoalteromonas carrageenovora]MDO6464922.1 hypothetical protein [Pseudoalteromonas carrageenovora]|tara:strand:- start:3511 stop:4350 length:840 start_codon:yes stop_codon:yes gene_type:complete